MAVADIALIEVESNPSRVHFGSERPLVRSSLQVPEDRLDPALFFRASRHQMFNLHFVESVDSTVDDRFTAHLRTAQLVDVSRRHSKRLRDRLSL